MRPGKLRTPLRDPSQEGKYQEWPTMDCTNHTLPARASTWQISLTLGGPYAGTFGTQSG